MDPTYPGHCRIRGWACDDAYAVHDSSTAFHAHTLTLCAEGCANSSDCKAATWQEQHVSGTDNCFFCTWEQLLTPNPCLPVPGSPKVSVLIKSASESCDEVQFSDTPLQFCESGQYSNVSGAIAPTKATPDSSASPPTGDRVLLPPDEIALSNLSPPFTTLSSVQYDAADAPASVPAVRDLDKPSTVDSAVTVRLVTLLRRRWPFYKCCCSLGATYRKQAQLIATVESAAQP
jgi:hypothetical protein